MVKSASRQAGLDLRLLDRVQREPGRADGEASGLAPSEISSATIAAPWTSIALESSSRRIRAMRSSSQLRISRRRSGSRGDRVDLTRYAIRRGLVEP